MINKSQIQLIKALKLKKYRYEYGLFIAEGVKLVEEILKSNFIIEKLFFTERVFETKNVIESYQVSTTELKKISSLTTPNRAIAVVQIPNHDLAGENIASQLSIALDGINDPGNLGTIIRIADWFGIKNIFCSDNSVDVYNPKVVQATMGSIARVKVHYTDLKDFLKIYTSKVPIYGAVLDGENIYQKRLTNNGVIILGNESEGISKEILNCITDKIKVPSFSADKLQTAESLNVAIATALICAEFRRVNK